MALALGGMHSVRGSLIFPATAHACSRPRQHHSPEFLRQVVDSATILLLAEVVAEQPHSNQWLPTPLPPTATLSPTSTPMSAPSASPTPSPSPTPDLRVFTSTLQTAVIFKGQPSQSVFNLSPLNTAGSGDCFGGPRMRVGERVLVSVLEKDRPSDFLRAGIHILGQSAYFFRDGQAVFYDLAWPEPAGDAETLVRLAGGYAGASPEAIEAAVVFAEGGPIAQSTPTAASAIYYPFIRRSAAEGW